MKNNRIKIRAVLFDFDGTLTAPGALDFAVIKREIGCPPERPVLEFLEDLTDADRRAAAIEALDAFETRAAAASRPATGAHKLLQFLKSWRIPYGILTRNSLQSVLRALENFTRIDADDFDLLISRDTPVRIKPHPEGVLMAAEHFGVAPAELLMVGDYKFDIEAGNRAGALTAHVGADEQPADPIHTATIAVPDLAELQHFIRMHSPLPAGKFPNDLLKEYLDDFTFDDPALLINPGIGEDTAAVDIRSDQVLILKSDPITFATDAAARYAVLVNANDIATAGADPRWLLTTLLFPVGMTAREIFVLLNDLNAVCRRWGVTLCGGHTEITDAVTRPVITGMMAGTLARDDLIDKRQMAAGDRLLITKAVAVEGTSLIAREFGAQLSAAGMAEADIAHCRGFLDKISILDEARIARENPGVSAMHDVTEGGLATAVNELSIAGGHQIRIDLDQIPVYPQTREICRQLDIDPLGLIGSGSLLISCRGAACAPLMDAVRAAGIEITPIGEVLAAGEGVVAVADGQPVQWPHFAVDEITRLYDGTALVATTNDQTRIAASSESDSI